MVALLEFDALVRIVGELCGSVHIVRIRIGAEAGSQGWFQERASFDQTGRMLKQRGGRGDASK
jgi:hypothetical protein